MPEDPWEDPAAKAWIRHIIDEMEPNMAESALVVQIVPDDHEGDVKFWVELGASIMLNKPILAVAFTDRPIPPKLALVADEIVYCPRGVDPASTQEVAAAIKRMVGEE